MTFFKNTKTVLYSCCPISKPSKDKNKTKCMFNYKGGFIFGKNLNVVDDVLMNVKILLLNALLNII